MSFLEPMTDEREIYVAALKLDNEEDQNGFLSRACRDQPKLRSRVERLLRARTQNESNLLVQMTGGRDQTPPAASDHETLESANVAPTFTDATKLPELDRYQLVQEIGRGGMGTVYLARQTEPVNREVAVKVINPGMDSREVLSRFEAERQTLALMEHPNIARVFDGGTTVSGLPFFAMELVRGLPITNYCHEHGLGLKKRIELFVDVCHAVQHAHQKGIIHRDLKPSNILVTRDDNESVVKVIDFGVAKALDRSDTDQTVLTQYPSFIGTPIYVSPEQARPAGFDVDTRSDVYSLGAVLYELLTGTTPFRRETLSEVGLDNFCELLTDKQPDRPSHRLSSSPTVDESSGSIHRNLVGYHPIDLQEELDWVVLKTLEKDRERRYESAKALADDLERYLRGEAVAACPPTFGYRLRKWVALNRVPVTTGGLAILALAFIAVTSLWQVRQVKEAWRESRTRELQAVNLLNANQLQSAVRAFRQSNIRSIPDLLRSGGESLKFENESQRPSYFRQLLRNLANPDHDQEMVFPNEVEDLAWDETTGHAWVLDVEGNVYRCRFGEDSVTPNSMARQPFDSVGESADSIAVSPDGKSLAIGTADGRVALWDVGPQPTAQRLVRVGDGGVETVVWSDDGSYLAAGTRYDGFWVGRANGDELFRVQNDHRHESLVFLPDGQQLVVPTRQGFDYYAIPDGTRVRSVRQEGEANPRELILAGPKKNWLLTCDRFRQHAIVYEAATGKEIGEVGLSSNYPQAITAWPDGRWVAALFPNGLLQIIDLELSRSGQVTGKSIAQFNIGDQDDVIEENASLRVLVSPQHDAFITAGPGGRVRRWSTGRVLPTQLLQPPLKVNAVYPASPDELMMFFATHPSAGHQTGDRGVPKGISKKSHRMIGAPIGMPVNCFSTQISSQGWVACAGPEHVTVYDLEKGRVVKQFTSGLADARVVEISNAGDAVAANGGAQGGVRAWATDDAWNSARIVLDEDVHVDGVMCFDRVGDEAILLYDESSERIVERRLGDESRRVLLEKKSPRYMSSAISSDERLLAIGSRDALQVVDLAGSGHGFTVEQVSSVRSMAFLPGGEVLLTGHDNGNVEGWHIPTQQSLGTFVQPTPSVGVPYQLSVFPQCFRLLVNYRHDGTIKPLIVGTDRIDIVNFGESK